MGVLQYDIASNTIGESVKHKDHVSNPLLANLAKRSQVLPFGSTVPKGGHKKINEAETFIGPGYYDH